MKLPTVSIIMPTHNHGKFIIEAIESVFAQTYKNYELIIINDGSTDNTEEALKPYLEKIVYLKTNRRGASGTRNEGIKIAKGEFIAFLDSDDLWLPNKLSIQMEFLEKNKDVDAVFSDTFEFENNKIISKSFKRYYFDYQNIFNSLLMDNRIPFLTFICKRNVLLDIGLLDENLSTCVDWDLLLRVAHKYKIKYIDAIVGKKRQHVTNISNNEEKMFLNTIKTMQKVSRFNNLTNTQKNLVNKKLRKTYFELGYLYFSDSKYLLAREYLWKNITSSCLLNLKALIYWLFTYCNISLIFRLRRFKRVLNIKI